MRKVILNVCMKSLNPIEGYGLLTWLRLRSELWVIEFHRRSSLHHVLESTLFLRVHTACCAEMGSRSRLVLRVWLHTEGRSSIIGLILVRTSQFTAGTASLRQGPPWEILFSWWVRWGLGNVSAWADSCRGRGLVLQTTASPVTEGILRFFYHFRLCLGQVLRPRSGLKRIELHLYVLLLMKALLLAQFQSLEPCISLS